MRETEMGETLAKKAARKIEYDRLSSLPDDVLQHILSFLDTKDVFLTRKLSRRWWKLSTSVSNLNFDSPKQLGEDADFIKFVNLALIHNTARKIDKFRLSFDCDWTEQLSAVNSWINFAMNKGVQELDLEFNKYYMSREPYQLPSLLSKCETLISLKLKISRIKVSNFASFPKLTAVSLDLDKIEDCLIERLLEGCPQLESLVFTAFCYGPSIKIHSSSSSSLRLKHLRMGGGQNSSVDVEAPNLEILEIYCNNLGKFSFKEMPFLREACLCVSCPGPRSDECIDSFEQLLLNLCHARVLRLSSTCLKVLSHRESMKVLSNRELKDTMVKLKHLILDSGLTINELVGIAYMLKNSLELEALVIKIVPTHLKFDIDYGFVSPDIEVEYWEDSLSPFSCHLKTIKILDRGAEFCMSLYKRSTNVSLEEEKLKSSEIEHGIAFLKGLLNAAVSLKKLTIVISKAAYVEEPEESDSWSLVLREVPNIINRFPRSSSIVDVSVIEG